MTEAGSRVIIDKLLSEVGWILIGNDSNPSIDKILAEVESCDDL